ncbi:protein kinase [Sorangium cellulosum]|uniref:Protein kinase n=1 Tax=Sorangium cellulosum TaxID=56 RepID=A0A4P2Q4E1_SORCE|nr:TOMM system kinase/cyclase fusion protein [Sorangium cellulosum]AUX23793.1 protein kinase [Sorangium cellulosum]
MLDNLNIPEAGGALRDRYELLDELGRGGFGTVYRAKQIATGQLVAVKVLRLDGGDSSSVEKLTARFRRETRLCGQLHHPNIVRLIDSGRTEAGTIYTVFEYVPGKNLRHVLAAEGALDPREARHLMLQVLDGLACAHALGVVHRDLKPSNLMIVPTGARRNALVLDFGIGALTDRAGFGDGVELTSTNEAVGTPGYAAPEQYRGARPTPRADLFAWGLVFLECLTGRRLFADMSIHQALLKLLGPEPIPLPAALAGHALGDLLRRVLVKDAAAREVDAAGVLRALDGCDLRGLERAELARPGGAPPRAPGGGATPTDGLVRTVARAQPAGDAGAALAAEARGASAPRLHGERRPFTALCVVLRATPERGRDVDVEDVDDLLGQGQAVVGDIARGFDGHVLGAAGEHVLVGFGYPNAREDDTPRAAQAALAIAAALRPLLAKRAIGAELRMGIHAGVMVARFDDPGRSAATPALGVTSQVAMQLAALAAPGTIAVSATAQRSLVQSAFALDPEGVRYVAGLARPVPIFTLREARRPEQPISSSSAGRRQVSVVGREPEIDLLLQCWAKARGGAGRCVLLIGEPGIGKSRLTRELDRRLQGEAHLRLECRCTPDTTNRALHPIIELLEQLLDCGPAAPPEERLRRVEAVLERYGFNLADSVPLFGALLSIPTGDRYAALDVSPQKQKELTLDATLALLCEMAEIAPLVLVVEDLHWADPTTLELLSALVSEAPSSPALVLLTARPELRPPWPPSGVLQIQLGRLDRRHVDELAGRSAGDAALPPEVLDRIADRADGVPLFVEELVRALIESGALARRDGRYELARSLADLDIPSTLRSLLMARLDRLGPAKQTAQIAAALGREFSLDVLAAVSPDGATVEDDLAALVASDLVHRRRRARNPLYVFKHALVRDAAYESLPRRARQAVHRQIARVLEQRFPEAVEDRPELLAMHHAAAAQMREAIAYAQRAAMRELMRSANAEAIGHARQAAGWLPAIEDERQRAELELGLNGILTPALMSTCGWADEAIRSTVERSQALIHLLGDSPHAVPTLWALIVYHHTRGVDRQTAWALARRLHEATERSSDTGHRVAAHIAMAMCQWIEGRYPEARALSERTLALYDPAEHRRHALVYGLDERVTAHLLLSQICHALGDTEATDAHLRAASDWSRELNIAGSVALSLLYASLIHQQRRDVERTLETTGALTEITERYGLVAHMNYGGVVRGWALRDAEQGRRHLAALEASGHELGLTYYRAVVAETEAMLGDHAAAVARLDRCLRHAQESGEHYYLSEVLRLKGTLLLDADRDAGEACLREAIEAARAQGAETYRRGATIALCRSLGHRGRGGEARALLAALLEGRPGGAPTPALLEARRLLQEIDARPEGPV